MLHDLHGTPFTVAEPAPRKPIRATPFVWRDPATIPPRRWLYGSHYIREYISTTVAPGGLGKSTLALVDIVAVATGRALVGIMPQERVNVWYWNGEDPHEEIERRVAAICIHYGIDPAELEGRLFIDSGRDTPVVVATETKDGATIARPVVDDLVAEMRDNSIGLLVVDPFVSCHAVSENDNNKISIVKNIFADIASETRAAVELVHHTRKGASGTATEHTVEDGRGASALLAGARSARVLNGMSKEQGEKAAVDNHRLFFNVSNGKANLAPPPDKADWYRLIGVPLGNGGSNPFDQGDTIGVVVKWEWPDAMADVSVGHLREVQKKVAAGRYRENHQAKNWVGHAVAEILHLDPKDKADKRKILSLMKIWTTNGMFVVVTAEDEHREMKPFVEVGTWATD
jgi:hypothetical protein